MSGVRLPSGELSQDLDKAKLAKNDNLIQRQANIATNGLTCKSNN